MTKARNLEQFERRRYQLILQLSQEMQRLQRRWHALLRRKTRVFEASAR